MNQEGNFRKDLRENWVVYKYVRNLPNGGSHRKRFLKKGNIKDL